MMKSIPFFLLATTTFLTAAPQDQNTNFSPNKTVSVDFCIDDCRPGDGPTGPTGPTGPAGPTGATGADGTGGILDFADFYALMPPDNAATVAVGSDVDFPQDGPAATGTEIVRTGADTFNLPYPGVYSVQFQVSVDDPGQLVLTLDGVELAYTVVGRETGTSQIVGIALVRTMVQDAILTVRNPASSSTALTITPLAGGQEPVSAHLVITLIELSIL